MTARSRHAFGALALLLLLSPVACTAPRTSDPAATTTTPAPDASAPPDFVNVVWRVSRSSSVSPGMLYTFLEDSTLVLASSTGAPAFGTWSYRDGALTMVEDGRAYPVDVVSLTPDSLSIVLRGPGLPVDMTLVPAQQPLAR